MTLRKSRPRNAGPGGGPPVNTNYNGVVGDNPLYGSDSRGDGVTGESNVGPGVLGRCILAAQNLIPGSGASDGVQGVSASGNGVHGVSSNIGVNGSTNGLNGTGVYGDGGDKGFGVRGDCNNGAAAIKGLSRGAGQGVVGQSAGGDGVQGICTSAVHAGVAAINDSGGPGLSARGTTGVLAVSAADDGMRGVTTHPKHAGVAAINDSGGPGLSARGTPAGLFQGDITCTGTLTANDVILPNSDCAEDFVVVESEIDAGTVVVMREGGGLERCGKEYDRRVTGVISGAGGLRPGIILGREESQRSRMPVALVGRAYCKVDASYSPVAIGDLLTTSPTPGHAMRATDPARAFGSVIGKALESLEQGCGLIPILVVLR